MRNKIKIIFFLLLIFILIFTFLNLNTTRTVGINYETKQYEIPIYLKILDFFDRHYNYKYIVKNINKNTKNQKDIVLNITKWVKNNIKKIPEGVDIIDNHPITIIERRLGTNDQFSDVLSVLFVYSKIDSFFLNKFGKYYHSITFFKFNNHWSIIDPYYSYLFLNNKDEFASIEDIKKGNWYLTNLELKKINDSNFQSEFSMKFNNYKEVINYYNYISNYLPSSKKINDTHIFERGGRSNIQKPFGRLYYEIYKKIKKNK